MIIGPITPEENAKRVERNRRRRHLKAAAKHYRDTVRVEGVFVEKLKPKVK